MKTKKLSRKLTLTKQTIANMEDREQDAVRGGANNSLEICLPTWIMTECAKTCKGSCPPQCCSGLASCCGSGDSIRFCSC